MRFKGFYVENVGWGISDTNTNIDYVIETKGDLIEFLKVLNKLSEENKELKWSKTNLTVVLHDLQSKYGDLLKIVHGCESNE